MKHPICVWQIKVSITVFDVILEYQQKLVPTCVMGLDGCCYRVLNSVTEKRGSENINRNVRSLLSTMHLRKHYLCRAPWKNSAARDGCLHSLLALITRPQKTYELLIVEGNKSDTKESSEEGAALHES